jgi:hypothetical protein
VAPCEVRSDPEQPWPRVRRTRVVTAARAKRQHERLRGEVVGQRSADPAAEVPVDFGEVAIEDLAEAACIHRGARDHSGV